MYRNGKKPYCLESDYEVDESDKLPLPGFATGYPVYFIPNR